jgi:hypothetical protein
MACGCKQKSNAQVSKMKQVVKKPNNNIPRTNTSSTQRVMKRLNLKRPI